MQWSRHLGDKAFWQTTGKLAVPIALQKLLMSSFTMVDTIMVGMLGDTALASVGIAGQWSFLLNVVFFGMTSGASVFIAQYWGSRDVDGIHRTYGLALTIGAALSTIFLLLALCCPRQVVGLFTTEQDVIEGGVSYLLIAGFSYPAIALNQVASTVLCGTERVKLPMFASMISVAVNAALNALFMFGLGMGVRGAALGTTISAWLAPAVLYAISLKRDTMLIAGFRRLTNWSLSFVKHYFFVSLPVLLNESMWALGTNCYNMIYGRLDIKFFAAITIFRSIEDVALTFFWGLCNACSVIVGKRIGAGEIKAAALDAHRFSILGPAFSVLIGLLLVALRPIVLLPFEVSEEVSRYAYVILGIYGLELGLRNIPAISIVGIFRAGGDTRTGLLYDGICLWLFALPLTLLTGYVLHWPLPLVYLVMLLSEDVPKSLLCLRRLKSRAWIRPVTGPARLEDA